MGAFKESMIDHIDNVLEMYHRDGIKETEIAQITGLDLVMVDYIIENYNFDSGQESDEYVPEDIDESMDGDAASALASVGWGTDEDYGYYGDE
jgi:hypothetical protein